jgi:hypothetical protein
LAGRVPFAVIGFAGMFVGWIAGVLAGAQEDVFGFVWVFFSHPINVGLCLMAELLYGALHPRTRRWFLSC